MYSIHDSLYKVLKHVLNEQFLKENVPHILPILNTVLSTISYLKRRGLCEIVCIFKAVCFNYE